MTTQQNDDEQLEAMLYNDSKLATKFEKNPSSHILEAKYISGTKALTVLFKADKERSYTFFEVPEKVVRSFFDAESPGKFFQSNIRGKYTFAVKTPKLLSKPDVLSTETKNLQTPVTQSLTKAE